MVQLMEMQIDLNTYIKKNFQAEVTDRLMFIEIHRRIVENGSFSHQ